MSSDFAKLALSDPQTYAHIRMDNREPTEILELLRTKYSHTVTYEQESIGDYKFSDVCIERKTVSDMLHSLRDGRIWEQLKNAKENFPRVMVILEGPLPYAYSKKTAIDEMKIIGGLLGVAMGWGIPVVPSNHIEQTAKIIDSAFRRANRDKIDYLKPTKKKHYTIEEVREDVLCSIPGIGRQTAKEILATYPTITAINTAPDKELRKVKRVGPKAILWLRAALGDIEIDDL